MKWLAAALVLCWNVSVKAQAPASVFVHFATDKYELTDATMNSLDSLTDNLDVSDRIELHGHCDAMGSAAYNDRLSARRVKAVLDYLVEIGWDKKDILLAKGHGENIPIASNTTAEQRSLNRRVEIKIIPGKPQPSQPVSTTPVKSPPVKTLTEKIADTATKAGTNITLRNINFYGSMHQFLPESGPMLIELLDVMKKFPKLVIRIEGHICCEPGEDDGYDQETGMNNLSEARAKAVKDYLVVNGIDHRRVYTKGFGHSAPIYPYPEKSIEEQKLNRRVEIKILSK